MEIVNPTVEQTEGGIGQLQWGTHAGACQNERLVRECQRETFEFSSIRVADVSTSSAICYRGKKFPTRVEVKDQSNQSATTHHHHYNFSTCTSFVSIKQQAKVHQPCFPVSLLFVLAPVSLRNVTWLL